MTFETDARTYYFLKGMSFIFAVVFLSSSIYKLLAPAGTVTINDEVVKATFSNMLPFLLTGSFAAALFFWMVLSHRRVRMNTDEVVILQSEHKTEIVKWEEIEKISKVEWLLGGQLVRAKLKNGRIIYFLPDIVYPTISEVLLGNKPHSGMAELISKKKVDLSI